MSPKSRQTGFTLIEMAVATVVMGLMVGIIYKALGPMLSWKSRADTEQRMALLKNALETAYRQNMVTIDGDAAGTLNFGAAGNIDPINPNGNGFCVAPANALAPIALLLRSSPNQAIRDGYGLNFCLAIDPRAAIAYNGQNLPYHPVAIVSGGPNGQIDAGTLFVNGQLTLASDDIGVVVDTAGQAIGAYERTMAALSKSANALQQYYIARYQSDPARTPGTDYFGCGDAACPAAAAANWDAANGLPTTCAGPVDMTTAAIGVVGLVREDVTDGYGQIIQYDNCGAGIRSPSNAVADMQLPPFTTAVQSTMPDGTQLIATAVGMAY